MRILLLEPEDSPERGPWSRQHWDLIVDFGKSSAFSEESWACQYGCPVLRSDCFRHGIADAKKVREIFSAGRGRLIDEEGIDWWDLLSLLVVPYALNLLALQSVAKEIIPSAELWATRPGGAAGILAIVLNRSVQTFVDRGLARSVARAMHYAKLGQRFSAAQIKEIFLDKYDSGYGWRSRFAARRRGSVEPLVVLPSAYENVSRMAAAYARLLPEQPFLMVATRQSAKQFAPPPNVHVQDLAAYAKPGSHTAEAASLIEQWMKLRADLQASPELQVLSRAGVLDSFPAWIRDGLSARNAWREVFEREVIRGVLCGDDSNRYTRLPVLLAARRKIPTVDFHHGALDGRYVFKDFPCDRYLAKSDMERDYLLRVCGLPAARIVMGAPSSGDVRSGDVRSGKEGQSPRETSIIFFSEPYEAAGMRTHEVYRELLPSLCRAARESGHGLILKLHPFESLSQRRIIVRDVLTPADCNLVRIVDGPLTTELMGQAWCGITVESTTVIDCLQNNICCFLCGWLAHSPFEYVQQYARFGIGEALQDAEQLLEIPRRVADFHNRPTMKANLSATVDPAMLKEWLTPAAKRSTLP
jgi:hypothetical protein